MRRPNAVQTLALGFALLILTGACLLSLPIASRSGESIPWTSAVFTAASASCVTGLTVYDTATQFSAFGQAVLLLLIQIGGLGFVTASLPAALLVRRRVGLRQRALLQDSVGALQLGGVVRLARRALLVTVFCEGLGAMLLALWFCPRYGLGKGLWMAVFHAVSAFCNAGFDLLGTGASITTEAGEPLLNLVLMALIICGGLGFLVWDDILTHGRRFRRWRLHSKIAFTVTLLLFAGGGIAFWFLEADHAFAGADGPTRALMAAFQSVTARTAGFASVDQSSLSQGRAFDAGFDVCGRGLRLYGRRRKGEHLRGAGPGGPGPDLAAGRRERLPPPPGRGGHPQGLLHCRHLPFRGPVRLHGAVRPGRGPGGRAVRDFFRHEHRGPQPEPDGLAAASFQVDGDFDDVRRTGGQLLRLPHQSGNGR